MSDTPKKYGNDEYTATPSHIFPSISKDSKGYICQECGHLEITLVNNIFDDLCPKCVNKALETLHVPHMVEISNYIKEHDIALEPTIKIVNTNIDRVNSEKTTVIIRNNINNGADSDTCNRL